MLDKSKIKNIVQNLFEEKTKRTPVGAARMSMAQAKARKAVRAAKDVEKEQTSPGSTQAAWREVEKHISDHARFISKKMSDPNTPEAIKSELRKLRHDSHMQRTMERWGGYEEKD